MSAWTIWRRQEVWRAVVGHLASFKLHVPCSVGEGVWMGIRCRVEVRLRGCDGGSCGVGEWKMEEEPEGGISGRLRARGTARKMAFSRACEDAFSHILLVLIPGKPASAEVSAAGDELF